MTNTTTEPSKPAAAQEAVAVDRDAFHAMNGELCDFAIRWLLDGDYLRCKGCKRPQLTNYAGDTFIHAGGCKQAETSEPHPWLTLRRIMRPMFTPVAAASADLTNWAAHYSINPTAVEALQSMLTSTDAAQDAVPYGYVFTDDPAKFAMPGSGFHFGPVPPTDAINVVPLYAAPVAAAPVDLDAHGLRALDNCIRDLRRLLELADDFALDDMQIQSFLTAIESMELRKVASTPAAPGIDLEQFREAVEHWKRDLHDDYKGGHIHDDGEAMRKADRLLALIDASPKGDHFVGVNKMVQDSPKGGSDARVTSWRPIAELPFSNDLFWFARGDTIDGPRQPQAGGYDADEWNWFAAAEAPEFTPEMDVERDQQHAEMQATSAEVGE